MESDATLELSFAVLGRGEGDPDESRITETLERDVEAAVEGEQAGH